ncbi:hypothetical protein Q5H93_12340 [Hymenobacter sp. ASUV-10]|uniref:Uncharacterized protein n=1 Tax=Hymenobacter aranciens TaxID=3063996 RepID=A0ABT9BB80_9BACT|nr:hypothetical protein [Hymenobacter sp. ASUV-10]MDO7875524.1 hypothetical protein [Hymenobacter sp. ASUV-10]
MKLPHLDQLVPLERGEAWLLARAVQVLVDDVYKAERPVPALEVLMTLPLAALLRNLVLRHQRELLRPPKAPKPGKRPKRPKPQVFRVSYDQLAALHVQRLALFHGGALSEQENRQLQGVVGKFHRESLNLDQRIRFA